MDQLGELRTRWPRARPPAPAARFAGCSNWPKPWDSAITCSSIPAWCAGLSYYTGHRVRELRHAGRQFRAIFGGGRYDNLFGDMTGVSRPAVGFGFGDVVIAEILSERAGWCGPSRRLQVCVGMFDAGLSQAAARVAAGLVAAGIQTDLAFAASKPGKFFSYADRRGALFTVFLAPAELQEGAAVVKEMASGTQTTVPLAHPPGRRDNLDGLIVTQGAQRIDTASTRGHG
jgi:histidyl-tRNA synthetase